MINIETFMQTLPMTLYGMGGIFLVILIIYLCVAVVNRVFGGKNRGKVVKDLLKTWLKRLKIPRKPERTGAKR